MADPPQILVIDDDAELCELLAELLGQEGYAVESARDAISGLARAQERPFTLVVLDVMLPGLNGFEVLTRLRQSSRVPVLMLTARGEDVDRIVGLEMGADDYLPKPFNPRELVARVRALHQHRRTARDPGDVRGPGAGREGRRRQGRRGDDAAIGGQLERGEGLATRILSTTRGRFLSMYARLERARRRVKQAS